MNTMHKLLIVFSVFCNALTITHEQTLTPQNSIIFSDIDGVVSKISMLQWPAIVFKSVKLIKNRHDIKNLAKTLWYIRKSFSSNAQGIYSLYDNAGNKIEGLTPKLLTVGMRHKEATPLIAPI